MKSKIQKIISCVLAVIVLLSTVSFTVAKHYCGDHVVDVTIFKEAKSCGMDLLLAQKTSLEHTITKSPCCKDEQSLHQGQDELKQSTDQITIKKQHLVMLFVTSYLEVFYPKSITKIVYKEYSPPPLIQDILLLNSTFLI